jgi:hypothetical protein
VNRTAIIRDPRDHSQQSNLLSDGIFLARSCDSFQYSQSQKYDRAHRNPVRRYVHQVRSVNQPADENGEPSRIDSERHVIRLLSQAWQLPLDRLDHFADGERP